MKSLGWALLFVIAMALLAAGPSPPAPAEPEQLVPDWIGTYYKDYKDRNRTCAYYKANRLPYVVQRFDNSIDFDWEDGEPAPGVGANNFLVCWTLQRSFSPGLYRFHVYVDDGVRFWINNTRIFDYWRDQPATHYEAVVSIPGNDNDYDLRLDYFEHLDKAIVRLWWEELGEYSDWKGEYFRNTELSGGPVITRNDRAIDFNWGLGRPAPDLSYDHFSVRWTRTIEFAGGWYRFRTETDDGVRLFIDASRDLTTGRYQNPIIDAWNVQPLTQHYADVYLSPGPHTIVMEYFEFVGTAQAKLTWERW